MKYFTFFTLLIFAFYLAGFIKKTEKYRWMDKDYTTAIKGVSILTVVWSHSGARLAVGGIQFIAGISVALFLLCSGYGLEFSYEKRGLRKFWKKRLLRVVLPFWGVELVGLLISENFSIKTYLLDCSFLKPATSYGWFVGYIIICYLAFYLVKRFITDNTRQMIVLFGIFAVWFILDSVFFANTDMPFLRARQMLSFPFGVLIALNKEKVEKLSERMRIAPILGGIMCFVFMALMQLPIVKTLPYLVSNAMSLLTCFPMAIAIILFGKSFRGLFENRMLVMTGRMSYEIYLVQSFTLCIIRTSIISVLVFVIVTYVLAYILHLGMGRVKDDRLNRSYINQK